MLRKEIIVFVGVFIILCGLYFIWSILITEPGFPLDDSWIHMVFARNIATGHGFAFNPDHPISGATAPLWTLLLVPFWLLLGPIAGGIIPGIILECLAIIAIYKLSVLLIQNERLAFLAAAFTSLTWVLVWAGLSGMEVGLYSALSLWGLYFYFKADLPNDRRNYLAYMLFVLAFLSRPECALFLAAAAIRDFIIWIRSENKSLLPWFWRILIAVALLAPYVAFNYSTTGTIFPQTFTAKVQGRGLISAISTSDPKRVIKTLTILPYYYTEDFFTNILILNPLLAIASIVGLFKLSKIKDALRSKRIMLVFLIALYLPLMGVFSPVMTPTYHYLRLVDNLIPLIIMLGMIGLFYDSNDNPDKIKRIWLFTLMTIFLIGIMMVLIKRPIVNWLSPYLVQDISTLSAKRLGEISNFVRDTGISIAAIPLFFMGVIAISLRSIQEKLKSENIRKIIIWFIIAYSTVMLIYGGDRYSNGVKNINECDKAAGIFLREHAKPGELAAVNDIGAIKYFSGIEIFDLKGLVSPEITPAMIRDDSLAFEYMSHYKHPDYIAIFPNWFNYIPRRTDIFKPMISFIAERNTILAGDTTIVYRAIWPDLTQ